MGIAAQGGVRGSGSMAVFIGKLPAITAAAVPPIDTLIQIRQMMACYKAAIPFSDDEHRGGVMGPGQVWDEKGACSTALPRAQTSFRTTSMTEEAASRRSTEAPLPFNP